MSVIFEAPLKAAARFLPSPGRRDRLFSLQKIIAMKPGPTLYLILALVPAAAVAPGINRDGDMREQCGFQYRGYPS